MNNLGTVLRAQGRQAEAVDHYRRAERLSRDAVVPDHPNLQAIRRNLALVGGTP